MIRSGVEDTRLEAKAKNTQKFEAKSKDNPSEDRPSRGQGHKRKCSLKKKVFKNFFSGDLRKKRSSQKFFRQSQKKNVFHTIFQALHKIITIQKIMLSSSRRQTNFRGVEASRPRTSKCVLEGKDVLVNSTSGYNVIMN